MQNNAVCDVAAAGPGGGSRSQHRPKAAAGETEETGCECFGQALIDTLIDDGDVFSDLAIKTGRRTLSVRGWPGPCPMSPTV